MNQRLLQGLAVVFTVLLALGGIAFAAPTVDTETDTTATTSDWTDGTTVTKFNASADEEAHLEAAYNTTNPGIEIIDPETGAVIVEYDEGDMTQTDADSANNEFFYEINVSHDELATVPMGASENKSITVSFINDTTATDPVRTNITVYLENTNERAVVRVGSTLAGNDDVVTLSEDEPLFGLLDTRSTSTIDEENVAVDGANTTVYMVYADDEVADTYDSALDRKLWGSYESGAFIRHHQLTLSDTSYRVYNEEAPEGVVDNEDATFGEWTTLNGEPTHRVTLGEEDFDGESSVDVTTKGNIAYGLTSIAGYGVKSYEDKWYSSLPGTATGDSDDSDD